MVVVASYYIANLLKNFVKFLNDLFDILIEK